MRRRILLAIAGALLIVNLLPFLIPLPPVQAAPLDQLTIDGGRFVEVAGLQTYVVERGPADGTPVVFVHGLFGSTFTWRNQLDALAAAGYRAIAFDRPGAGLSAKRLETNYSSAAQADFIAALFDALGVESAVVVGHSAGGGLLAAFSQRHPARVMSAVYVAGAVVGSSGPPPFVGALVSYPPVTRWGRLIVRGFLTRDRLADTLRSFYLDPADATDEVIAGYWRTFQTEDWDAGLIGLSRDISPRLSDAELGALTLPALLLWGESDTWVPVAQGERLAQLLPNARLEILPGAGHQAMEETPEAFNAALLAWLGAG